MTSSAETFAYDEVAYPTPVVPLQTPAWLYAAGLLHGWRAPAPATARVLEIGCGDGLNLMAIAAVAPGSHCVGFDLSAAAVERGQALLALSELPNVELHQGDILTFPRDGEPFDYIVSHGVYSWVPPAVREGLLELIGRRLAPGGVAMVSFETLPAAAPKAFINAFLKRELDHVSGFEARCNEAARLIAMLARNQRPESRLTVQLERLLADLPSHAPGYFYHDWLAEHYAPTTLDDFSAGARRHGLKRAGESALFDLLTQDLDAEARELVEGCGDDIERRSNLLQMLRGAHQFRREMLMRADAPPPPVSRDEALRSLSFQFPGSREVVETADGPAVRYADGTDQYMTTNDPELQNVLDALLAVAPGELSFEHLLAETGVGSGRLADVLQDLTTRLLVVPYGTPQNWTEAPGARPRAGALIRAMAILGSTVISLRHGNTMVDDETSRTLLALADGTRSRDELAVALSQQSGDAITAAEVDAALRHFASHRLFEA